MNSSEIKKEDGELTQFENLRFNLKFLILVFGVPIFSFYFPFMYAKWHWGWSLLLGAGITVVYALVWVCYFVCFRIGEKI